MFPDCKDCGKSFKMCSCDHVFPYEGPAGSSCRRCSVYQAFVLIGTPTSNTWDWKSTCLQVRRASLARQILTNRRVARENVLRIEFMRSHPSDFYWIAFKYRNIPNHPFVSYLNGSGIFTNRPDPEDTEDVGHYWRDVEVLGRCEIPDHVQARIDAEFVMYS